MRQKLLSERDSYYKRVIPELCEGNNYDDCKKAELHLDTFKIQIPKPDGRLIAELAERYGHRHVHYVPEKETLPDAVLGLVQPGDVILMMGAGDIWRYSRRVLDKLKEVYEQEKK